MLLLRQEGFSEIQHQKARKEFSESDTDSDDDVPQTPTRKPAAKPVQRSPVRRLARHHRVQGGMSPTLPAKGIFPIITKSKSDPVQMQEFAN
jgi:hypothetical protein